MHVSKCRSSREERQTEIVYLGRTSASLLNYNAITSSIFLLQLLLPPERPSFKLQRCWNACMWLYFPAPSSTQDVISTAKWNRTDSFCRRNMTDTSPDGDSFSALWKFLTNVASQVKNLFTIQSSGLCCYSWTSWAGARNSLWAAEDDPERWRCAHMVFPFFFFWELSFPLT